MDKKEQIAYVKAALKQAISQRLEVEVVLMGLKSMNLVGKDQTKVSIGVGDAENAKANLDQKIRAYRQLIQRLENGEFIV